MKNIFLFIVDFLCSFSIQNSKVTKANPDNFFQIKYETLLKNKETISLSQIASNIEYIQLETKDECLLSGGVKIQIFIIRNLQLTRATNIYLQSMKM